MEAYRAANETTPVSEISILWISAGLSCDGDSIAMTAATQPSIEDLLSGAIPWTPRVRLYNPFLGPENGEEFLEFFRRGAAGDLDPFILVIEGSIPDETNKAEGYWASLGTDPMTGQPITTCEWIDRLPRRPGRWSPQGRARRTAASTPWPAIRPAAWDCLTIWAGIGNRVRGFPSSASPAVRSSRTT